MTSVTYRVFKSKIKRADKYTKAQHNSIIFLNKTKKKRKKEEGQSPPFSE